MEKEELITTAEESLQSEPAEQVKSVRPKQLTAKMQESLEEELATLRNRRAKAWLSLQGAIEASQEPLSIGAACEMKEIMKRRFTSWSNLLENTFQLLSRLNTPEALKERSELESQTDSQRKEFTRAIQRLDDQIQQADGEQADPQQLPGMPSAAIEEPLALQKGLDKLYHHGASRTSSVASSEVALSHRSHRSRDSRATCRSSTSSRRSARAELELMAVQAKIEAAITERRMGFAEIEAKLQTQRAKKQTQRAKEEAQRAEEEAQLQARLKIEEARLKKEEAAIKAMILENSLKEGSLAPDLSNMEEEDPKQKVSSYLASQQLDPEAKDFQPKAPPITMAAPIIQSSATLPPTQATTSTAVPVPQQTHQVQPPISHNIPPKNLGDIFTPTGPGYQPIIPGYQYDIKTIHSTPTVIPAQQQPIYTSTNAAIQKQTTHALPSTNIPNVPGPCYMVTTKNPRRDLTDRGVQKFSEKPEDYILWKTIFQRAIKDMRLSPEEELTLLIAWLGTSSSEQVKRIYAAHISDPVAALQASWARLDHRYGSAAQIEVSLLHRLKDFPQLTMRDNKKLWDLLDLLQELQTAKHNPQFPGLVSLDQHLTQMEIITKLPFPLREKWGQEVYYFKELYNQVYPPFSHLVNFVAAMAHQRNDPQTGLADLYQNTKTDKNFTTKTPGTKPAITVRKTGTSGTKSTDKTKPTSSESTSQTLCLIHQKPHHISECKEFRRKPYEDRIALLKQHNTCFRCCSSTDHLARDCTEEVKCEDCNSTRHCTALHKGQSSQRPEKPTAAQPEPATSTETETVGTSCTALRKEPGKGQAHHPICLAKVFPSDYPEAARKIYVALDTQSDTSLAAPEFFNLFKVQATKREYIMTTCAGEQAMVGRNIKGFTIEALHSKQRFQLPTLTECESIPRSKDQISTKTTALQHPHLQSIAQEIPELDPKAEILLLIGTDCTDLLHVKQQVTGPARSPFAQETPLGWTIIGPASAHHKEKPTRINTLATSLTSKKQHTQSKNSPVHNHAYHQDFTTLKPAASKTTSCNVQRTPHTKDKQFTTNKKQHCQKGNRNNLFSSNTITTKKDTLINTKTEQSFTKRNSISSQRKQPNHPKSLLFPSQSQKVIPTFKKELKNTLPHTDFSTSATFHPATSDSLSTTSNFCSTHPTTPLLLAGESKSAVIDTIQYFTKINKAFKRTKRVPTPSMLRAKATTAIHHNFNVQPSNLRAQPAKTTSVENSQDDDNNKTSSQLKVEKELKPKISIINHHDIRLSSFAFAPD